MRLTRRHSMTRAYEFARVRAEGVSQAGRCVVISAAPLTDIAEPSRFGIICTKKVGHAVVRNLLRRRTRELLRAHGEDWAAGWHVVVVMRWRAAEAPFAVLEKDFRKTLGRLARAAANRQNAPA